MKAYVKQAGDKADIIIPRNGVNYRFNFDSGSIPIRADELDFTGYSEFEIDDETAGKLLREMDGLYESAEDSAVPREQIVNRQRTLMDRARDAFAPYLEAANAAA
jgi:hypothetical protein